MRMLKQTFSPTATAVSVSSFLLTQSSNPGENSLRSVVAQTRHTRLTKASITLELRTASLVSCRTIRPISPIRPIHPFPSYPPLRRLETSQLPSQVLALQTNRLHEFPLR
jgi:hypothetical protein